MRSAPHRWANPLADLSFWQFWRYEPHNNILWVWLKTGTGGFTLFWTLLGFAIMCAANFAKVLRGPDEYAFALFALDVVMSSRVFCWVDTGLTSPRFTVVLGTTLGAFLCSVIWTPKTCRSVQETKMRRDARTVRGRQGGSTNIGCASRSNPWRIAS